MERTLQDINSGDTLKVLELNERLLNCLGIWPLNIQDVPFLTTFFYMGLHCSLMIADLFDSPRTLEDIITNISENVLFLMTLGKMGYCRIYHRSIAQLLIDVKEDFVLDKYERKEDKLIYWNYNRKSYKYTLLAVPTMTSALFFYYITHMTLGIELIRANSSLEVHLPYKARVFVDLRDQRIYYFCSLCQIVPSVIVVCGYVGLDCLFASLAFHITAQFKILKCNIDNVLNNDNYFQKSIKELVTRHQRIIRLAETLENEFNMIIFQQLLGTTVHICISIYNSAVLEFDDTGPVVKSLMLICFVLYGFNTVSTLFIYCYIGEGLITESVNLGEALYHYEWCNISPSNLKLIQICMVRARKPLQLTSGKFFVLSLSTFTETLKATMGYFSVLRNTV